MRETFQEIRIDEKKKWLVINSTIFLLLKFKAKSNNSFTISLLNHATF